MKTVYLCGAINGCTDDECRNWRNIAKDALDDLFRFLDPMRRDFSGIEDQSVYQIVRGDYEDIEKSDIILAVADRPSWGTAMEIHQAFRDGKAVVTVCGQDRISPWLRYHSTRIVPTLDDAIKYVRNLA